MISHIQLLFVWLSKKVFVCLEVETQVIRLRWKGEFNNKGTQGNNIRFTFLCSVVGSTLLIIGVIRKVWV
jgi:hypothetical protein